MYARVGTRDRCRCCSPTTPSPTTCGRFLKRNRDNSMTYWRRAAFWDDRRGTRSASTVRAYVTLRYLPLSDFEWFSIACCFCDFWDKLSYPTSQGLRTITLTDLKTCCGKSLPWENPYDTIRYDSVYLTCSKKLTGSQLSLPHGTNTKLKMRN